MKSIKSIVPILGFTCLLAACNYNEFNFPGYNDGVAPVNVFSYVDSLTSTDIVNLSTLIINNIKSLKTKEDSVAANYKVDSAAADYMKVNKMFHTEIAPADIYIPLFLSKKYQYGDTKSSVLVTSPQYIASEGELQFLKEKYLLDSIWYVYRNEILNASFESNLCDFSGVNVQGTQVWSWNNYKYAKMSGYANGVNNDNEDWLISPALDLSKRISAFMTFSHTINKGDTANMRTNHTICISTDYVNGDPSSATWIQMTIPTYPLGKDWVFVESGNIEFPSSAIGSSNVHFAFKYLSSSAESATWEIKNLLVLEVAE
jgi:hypothetical protein